MRVFRGFSFSPGMDPSEFESRIRDIIPAPVRTIYVDVSNGDDNNPGTQDKPLKTLERALWIETFLEEWDYIEYNRPGLYAIILASGVYEIPATITYNKWLFGSMVAIWGQSSATTAINVKGTLGILKSRLSLYNCRVDGTQVPTYGGFNLEDSSVKFYNCEINIGPYHFINTISGKGGVEIELCKVVKTGNGVLFNAGNKPADYVSVSTTIVDSAGTTLQDTDILTGIVRDTNNLPRNVRSNVVL